MIQHITNEQEYQQALSRLNELFDAALNSPEGGELRQLAALIEQYEEEHMEDEDDGDE